MTSRLKILLISTHLLASAMVGVATAQAQSFVSPLVGFNFGGDSGCLTITECEERRLNFGIAFGRMGNVFGAETEIAYARDFFGEAPGLSSSVLTWMGNVMLVPNFGILRPYGLFGVGLMRSRVELTLPSLLEANNQFAWNVGGGVMLFVGEHVGLRGDIRYFHSLQELPVVQIPIGGERLDFGRASAALVLRF